MSKTYIKVIFVLSLCGVLFSGYLSFSKLITGICALNEPCPYFLGYPACWFGFGMFLTLFILSIIAKEKGISILRKLTGWITAVSTLGILFAGKFVIPEISLILNGVKTDYGLILPTCTYGLVFFIAVFITSLLLLKQKS